MARVPRRNARPVFHWLFAGLLLATTSANVSAESMTEGTDPFETATELTTAAESVTTVSDPFEADTAIYDPFESLAPVIAAAYVPKSPVIAAQHELVFLQPPSGDIGSTNETSGDERLPDSQPPASTDPCAGAAEKSMAELGIDIMLPSGLLPKDHASLCWADRNAIGGPYATMRCWPMLSYFWDAPCLCYRPLYFEEINLERYGYGCCACIQPAVSAAHFFGTVPCLPYCMADHCPCECEYTLGHYRPGSCPPWRYHWPSCRPIAAAAEAGVMTGLIFAIP